MRKKRFLAIVTAIIFSISLAAPVTVSATEAEEAADLTDEEQEEGEQTTIVAPGAEDEDASGNGGSSTGSSSGNTGTGSSAATTTAKSSDSSLSHLGISPGSLSPAFSAGTHEYTATVDAGVTAISVAAKPNSSKAVIASVSGAKSLTPGANTVKVIVEAENGATLGKFELAKMAKEQNLDAIHDTVHEMAKDEARHGKAFEVLLKRYF